MLGNVIWWAGYLVVAIWLQRFIPGLDALIPGFLVCLQERNRQQTATILLISVIIQEGAGTLPFGLSLLWHGVVVALYYIGIRLFISSGSAFTLLLSFSLALSRALFMLVMDFLQPLPMDLWTLSRVVALQLLFTPLLWILARRSREKRSNNAHHR